MEVHVLLNGCQEHLDVAKKAQEINDHETYCAAMQSLLYLLIKELVGDNTAEVLRAWASDTAEPAAAAEPRPAPKPQPAAEPAPAAEPVPVAPSEPIEKISLNTGTSDDTNKIKDFNLAEAKGEKPAAEPAPAAEPEPAAEREPPAAEREQAGLSRCPKQLAFDEICEKCELKKQCPAYTPPKGEKPKSDAASRRIAGNSPW